MPGVIQPQRPQGFMNTALSLGQTASQMKGAFGGGSDPTQTDPTTPTAGQQPDPTTPTAGQQPDPTTPTAGQQPDPTQMAQGNAVTPSMLNTGRIQRRINSLSGQGNGGY